MKIVLRWGVSCLPRGPRSWRRPPWCIFNKLDMQEWEGVHAGANQQGWSCAFSRLHTQISTGWNFPTQFGGIWLFLKGALDNLLQPCGDGATKESAEHGDVCRHVHSLSVDPHLDPEPDPLKPDLAAVG